MHRRSILRPVAVAIAAVVSIAVGAPRAQGPTPATTSTPASGEGWVQLFNGRNLDGWYTFLARSGKNNDPSGSVRVENGMIHVLGNPVGTERPEAGYLATTQEYSNYRLRLEYKWGASRFPPRHYYKRDNGLLFHVSGPDRVWPTCVEFQIQETDVGDAIPVNGARYVSSQPANGGNGLAPWPNPPNANNAVSRRLAKRLGDFEDRDGWNVLELIANGDKAAFIVNGRLVNSVFNMQRPEPWMVVPPAGTPQNAEVLAKAQMVTLDRGRIAIEVEYAEVWFRSIAIRPLTDND
jgi:hypothetical protein